MEAKERKSNKDYDCSHHSVTRFVTDLIKVNDWNRKYVLKVGILHTKDLGFFFSRKAEANPRWHRMDIFSFELRNGDENMDGE